MLSAEVKDEVCRLITKSRSSINRRAKCPPAAGS